MSKHTEGPWAASGTIIQDKTKRTVAQVWPNTRLSSSKSLAQMKANARLVAAAPELLAALQMLGNDVWGISDKAAIAVEAAIAKATE